MVFPNEFIRRSEKYTTLESWVSAPCFRKTFYADKSIKNAELLICGLGFYEVYINGKDITKGLLAPYRSNLNHFVYYDKYDITEHLEKGKNVISVLLGNGMKNAFGAFVWDFDKADWVGAPQVAFSAVITDENNETFKVISDTQTKTADSPIIFDDLHFGEYYDANLEIGEWTSVEYDDSGWDNAIPAPTPAGECRLCEAEPIVFKNTMKPVSVTECQDGYVYDFGINGTGVCELSVSGEKGQKICLRHFEKLVDGKPFFGNIGFDNFPKTEGYQKDIYICNGKEKETHIPKFTYHGFRYVYVTGINPSQATPDLLKFISLNSDIKQIGDFVCSDEMANKIQKATQQSDITNFHYFPTDCPQREKNGWTADASLSAEQCLLNFAPEKSYKEWIRNICKAVDFEGKLPGIIPTAGWGYQGCNGPAWDNVIVNLPYYTYIYRGDSSMFEMVAMPLKRYLQYLKTKLDKRGLIEIGLGDWCQPKTAREDYYKTPLVVTASIMVVDIARKAAFIYKHLNMTEEMQIAESLASKVRDAIREHLIDRETFTVYGETQTAQVMAIYYDIFEDAEKEKALTVLLDLLEQNDSFMDTGVLGARVLFRTLSDYGYADLAYDMITREEFPSYGNWIKRGATTLWEIFTEDDTAKGSLNHHFWGDVSAWFYTYLAGIRVIRHNEIEINPCFVKKLTFVNAHHILPDGKVSVSWKREQGKILLHINIPAGVKYKFICPSEYEETKKVTPDGIECVYKLNDEVF